MSRVPAPPLISVERFLAILADVRAELTAHLGADQAEQAILSKFEDQELDPPSDSWDAEQILRAAENASMGALGWCGDVEGFIDTHLSDLAWEFIKGGSRIGRMPESLSAVLHIIREGKTEATERWDARWEKERQRRAFEKQAKAAGYVLAVDFTVASAPAPPPLYGPGTFGVPGELEDLEPFMSRKTLKALLYLYRRADDQGYVATSAKTLSRFLLGSSEERAGRRMLKRFRDAGLLEKVKRSKGMPSAGQDAHRNLLRYYRLLTPPADLSAAKAIFQAHTGRWPEKGQVVEAPSQSARSSSMESGPLDTGL
jgi:hypothetical protein